MRIDISLHIDEHEVDRAAKVLELMLQLADRFGAQVSPTTSTAGQVQGGTEPNDEDQNGLDEVVLPGPRLDHATHDAPNRSALDGSGSHPSTGMRHDRAPANDAADVPLGMLVEATRRDQAPYASAYKGTIRSGGNELSTEALLAALSVVDPPIEPSVAASNEPAVRPEGPMNAHEGFQSSLNSSASIPSDLVRILQAIIFEQSSIDTVARAIQSALSKRELSFEVLQAAVLHVLFDKLCLSERLEKDRSILPIIQLVLTLDDEACEQLKEKCLRSALAEFSVAREPHCNRADFFAHAEVFAALIHTRLIHVDLAMQTICALIAIPGNRCAALTALGKSVELCGELLSDECKAESLLGLRDALADAKEEEFIYDVQYVTENLQWPPATTSEQALWSGKRSAEGVQGAQEAQQFQHQLSLRCSLPLAAAPTRGTRSGCAMSYSVALDKLVCASAHGSLSTFSALSVGVVAEAAAQPHDQGSLGRGFPLVCSLPGILQILHLDLAVHQGVPLLFGSAMLAQDPRASEGVGGVNLGLAGLYEVSPGKWNLIGSVRRPCALSMGAVLQSQSHDSASWLALAETEIGPDTRMPRHIVSLWDRETLFARTQPSAILQGHLGAVTCLASIGEMSTSGNTNASSLCSGAEDGDVRIWDVRSPLRSTATLTDTAVALSPVRTMSAAANDFSLVSGYANGRVLVWDCRVLGGTANAKPLVELQTDYSSLLCMCAGPKAELYTLSGLGQRGASLAVIDTSGAKMGAHVGSVPASGFGSTVSELDIPETSGISAINALAWTMPANSSPILLGVSDAAMLNLFQWL
ncbi:hypothetical protein FVE85_2235 [Porphyridium purpureum]|uniref:Uncharacterized protein n=1 Tax=Porphyridium purpureum TaxID=35688 RepID=A0A5J4YYM5_PORPP|nr:hypothetical protein FVE85_2235 [Porphyridium purpureum]|eukprot:POR8113..scf209_3